MPHAKRMIVLPSMTPGTQRRIVYHRFGKAGAPRLGNRVEPPLRIAAAEGDDDGRHSPETLPGSQPVPVRL